jgi:uroporphyrinogen-III decarboxylase
MPAEDYDRLLREGQRYFASEVIPQLTPLFKPPFGFSPVTGLKIAREFFSWLIFSNHMLDEVEKEYGIPMLNASVTIAPYDVFSLFYRGLEGLSKDLFRYGDKVEIAVHMMVKGCLTLSEFLARLSGINSVGIMCERAFSLSPRHFKRFYLPTLKQLIETLVDHGIRPQIYLEGTANQCLEYLLELPPQKSICHIDQSDIFKAKKILAGHTCVAGNVPFGILTVGSTEDVKEYCKRLLGEVAPGGGYIMAGALGIPDNARPENVRTMLEYTIENGKY